MRPVGSNDISEQLGRLSSLPHLLFLSSSLTQHHFYFWPSIYPRGISGMTRWRTTLSLLLPCSIYTHVCACVYTYLGQGARHLRVCACQRVFMLLIRASSRCLACRGTRARPHWANRPFVASGAAVTLLGEESETLVLKRGSCFLTRTCGSLFFFFLSVSFFCFLHANLCIFYFRYQNDTSVLRNLFAAFSLQRKQWHVLYEPDPGCLAAADDL